MKNDQADLEAKKEGLSKKLTSLKERFEKEERARKYLPDIEKLESEIKLIDDQIWSGRVQEAKIRVKEIEPQAKALAEEKKHLLDRIREVDVRFTELLIRCEEIIPRKRLQISSKKFVKLEKEIIEAKVVAFVPGDKPVLVGGMEIGREFVPQFDRKKKILENEIPNIQSSLDHALELGWHLKEGESLQPEKLDDSNSIWVLSFGLPEIFYAGI